ncbi:Smr domain [Sesbania bispinosa]|nr:Smr domain [Sesbania bispinosa]
MKGREKMDIAQELNSKAATEIFKFNNRKNHIWRMDLHGLHASEAVQALQDRLHKIESEGSEHVHTKPVRHLLVITGVGKHSQGKPVLPTTVKSFLDKYR